MNDRFPGMYDDFTGMNHNGFRDFHVGGDLAVYIEADLIDKRIAARISNTGAEHLSLRERKSDEIH